MKPYFALTPAQLAAIHQLERDSFLEYCRRRGLSEQAASAEVVASLRQEIRLILAAERLDESGRTFYESLLASTDIWDLSARLHDVERNACIESIVRNPVGVDFSYLSLLSREIGAKPPKDGDTEALRAFLTAIPTISLWTTDFNAFVTRRSKVGNIPCICVYHHLELAIKAFADVILPAVVTKDGSRSRLMECDEVHRYATANDFMDSCKQVLGMLFGGSAAATLPVEYLFRLRYPELLTEFDLIVVGSQQFVWFHEFGHLVMGHLVSGPSHRIELDADFFATMMILSMGVDNPEAQANLALGVVILLFALCVLECKSGSSNKSTHPPAGERLSQFLSMVAKHFGYLIGVVEKLETACNPTLRRHWNSSVRCDLTRVNSWL